MTWNEGKIDRKDEGNNGAGGTVVVKVDGVQVISASYSSSQQINCSNTDQLRVLTNAFDGKMWELRIWKLLIAQSTLDQVANAASTDFKFVPQKQESALYFFGRPDDNSHGTGVADIINRHNKGGGMIHVYNFGVEGDLSDAYAHIRDWHSEVDVISTSLEFQFPMVGTRSCVSPFDNVLADLVWTRNVHISGAEPNPNTFSVRYPADTTYAISSGGIQDPGNSALPWEVPSGAQFGDIVLSLANCDLQYNYHAGTDGNDFIFKPDVYGTFLHYVDDDIEGDGGGGIIAGNSFAQPQTASGLGDIVSRFDLGLSPWIYTKLWSGSCFSDAVRLIWASNGDNGQSIFPPAAYNGPLGDLKGRLQDHDAWYKEYKDSYSC